MNAHRPRPGSEHRSSPRADGADLDWERAAPLLRLRLRSARDPTICGRTVGDGLWVQLVLECAASVMPVRYTMLAGWGRDELRALDLAERQTLSQPIDWSTYAVLAGEDAGSTLFIGGGGACVSGVVADLASLVLDGLRLPALVLVPSDHVVLVASPAPGALVGVRSILAARLDRIHRSVASSDELTMSRHRQVLWCRGSGRLTIFDGEDS